MTLTRGARIAGVATDKANRHPEDWYVTPPEGILPLLEVERFEGAIWEPCCGNGALSRELTRAGYRVFSTDLVDRGYGVAGRDFLKATRPLAPNIVTNPPYRIATEIVRHALSLSTGKVAMLCRLAFLEGIERRRLFEASPLARVWIFSNRLSMYRGGETMDNGGMVAFAWFVWEHGHKGQPKIGWL